MFQKLVEPIIASGIAEYFKKDIKPTIDVIVSAIDVMPFEEREVLYDLLIGYINNCKEGWE